MLFGITNEEARSMAYQLAVRNGIRNNFDVSSQTAGKNWLEVYEKGFLE